MVAREQELRRVARAAFGERGRWAYEAFDKVNAALFGGRLPVPWIQWAITPHAACLGWTDPRGAVPVVTLHPSTLGGTESKTPWATPARRLGPAYAVDTLIHECMHVALADRPRTGTTSHNCTEWIAEVNRIAPLLGFEGRVAGRSVTRREGKAVRRVTEGNIPFRAVAGFRRDYRAHLRSLN
jgi:hypothetical protein